VNVVALHIPTGVSVLLKEGIGLTVTVTFWGASLHPLAVVVIAYVTTIGAVVVLVNVSLMPPVPLAAAWLMPATNALVHAKVAPAVALVGV
jgi:hypothetical protein